MSDIRDEPGKYDYLARLLCITLKADAVSIVVLNGDDGSGGSSAAVSPQAQLELADLMRRLPDFQEQHARDIQRRG